MAIINENNNRKAKTIMNGAHHEAAISAKYQLMRSGISGARRRRNRMKMAAKRSSS